MLDLVEKVMVIIPNLARTIRSETIPDPMAVPAKGDKNQY